MELVFPGCMAATEHDVTQVKKIGLIGLGARADILASETLTEDLLTKAVPLIGMTLLDAPRMYSVELELEKLGKEIFEDEGGVTGSGVLSTSHIHLHGWPLRRKFDLDIYSCRPFNAHLLIDFIQYTLQPAYLEFHDLSLSAEPKRDWRDFVNS
jgi:S-adenosylmethionine/arginine decarboxylase-like enzyme